MELAMRGKIDTFKEFAGRHHRKPYTERFLDVVDDRPTGELLLDEALKIIRAEQSGNRSSLSTNNLKSSSGRSLTNLFQSTNKNNNNNNNNNAATTTTTTASSGQGNRHSVMDWVDLLSGK
jgi:hypothetical protein